jgi:hypothetical protein
MSLIMEKLGKANFRTRGLTNNGRVLIDAASYSAPSGQFLAVLQIQISSSILECDPDQIGHFQQG